MWKQSTCTVYRPHVKTGAQSLITWSHYPVWPETREDLQGTRRGHEDCLTVFHSLGVEGVIFASQWNFFTQAKQNHFLTWLNYTIILPGHSSLSFTNYARLLSISCLCSKSWWTAAYIRDCSLYRENGYTVEPVINKLIICVWLVSWSWWEYRQWHQQLDDCVESQ